MRLAVDGVGKPRDGSHQTLAALTNAAVDAPDDEGLIVPRRGPRQATGTLYVSGAVPTATRFFDTGGAG